MAAAVVGAPAVLTGRGVSATGCACRVVLRIALHACALLLPALAIAADLRVNPIRIELSPQHLTAAINIQNISDQLKKIQVRAVAWSHLDGKHVYAPTRELLASPQVFSIAPGRSQIVRTALRRTPDPANELAYRIQLRELRPQSAPESTRSGVALRLDLPVFVQPQNGIAAPKLVWTVSSAPDNRLKVTLRNEGNAHVEVSDFAVYAAGSEKPLTGESVSTWILAGQVHTWVLTTAPAEPPSGDRLRLSAYTDAGNIEAELSLGAP